MIVTTTNVRTTTRCISHVLACLAVVFCLTPANATAQNGPLKGFDKYVEAALRDWDVPGIAIAVVKNDSVIFARGFGVRTVGTNEPVDENTIFAIASTTKAFTSAMLGTLVDEKKLKWDDRVTDVYPGFKLSDPYATYELTVRDMLSHRSGLPRGDRLWYQSPYDRDEVIKRVRYLPANTSFRSSYGYQNIMFITAGEIYAKVSGETWDAGVRRRIFEPLGMTRTSTSIKDIQGDANVASAHDRIDGKTTRINWPNYDNLGGAGAINSTVKDLANWVRTQLNKGEFNGKRIFSDSVSKEMHAAQTTIRLSKEIEELFPETHFSAYGLGWTLRDYRGRKIVGHAGNLDGMSTQILMAPEEKLGVIAIANFDSSNLPFAMTYRVMDLFFGKPVKDWSALYLERLKKDRLSGDSAVAKRNSERIPNTQPRLPLKDYAGTYTDPIYGKAIVKEENGRLTLEVGPYFKGVAEHWHYDTFRFVWNDPELGAQFATFVFDMKGKPSELRLEGWSSFRR